MVAATDVDAPLVEEEEDGNDAAGIAVVAAAAVVVGLVQVTFSVVEVVVVVVVVVDGVSVEVIGVVFSVFTEEKSISVKCLRSNYSLLVRVLKT